MAETTNPRIVRIAPLLIAVWLVGVSASAETSTYVFLPGQSRVVQTGGIASVHWTYSIKGHFQLTVDWNAGTASFAHVDANATDDSPFKRTLDPNHVFNMTSLVGAVVGDTTIKFTGKAPDDSDVSVTVTFQNDLAHLIGQTTPPPNSADFFIFSLDAVAQLRKYGGGSGTAEDPYQIATAADLIALGETPTDYDKHFILTDDIDLDPNLPDRKVFDRAVIAPDVNEIEDWFQGTPFTGVFDGNSHTISHLVITGGSILGLFGQLASGAEVKDIGMEDVNITGSGEYISGLAALNTSGTIACCYVTGNVAGNNHVGGLVACEGYGSAPPPRRTITDCYVTAAVTAIDQDAGGLVGNNQGSIRRCYCTGPVTAISSAGGLVGRNEGDLTECYSTGTVSGRWDVGGLVGANYEGGTVAQCYSTGAVSGDWFVGGLVGNNGGTVTESYSCGAVVATEYAHVGGLVGSLSEGAVVSSFWDIETTDLLKSGGGTGKTTAQMQTAATFLDAGWDFVNVWGIGENQTYPYLRKYSAGDINQDGSLNFLDLAVLAENWLGGFD